MRMKNQLTKLALLILDELGYVGSVAALVPPVAAEVALGGLGGVVRRSASLANSAARCRARWVQSPSATACIRQAIHRTSHCLCRAQRRNANSNVGGGICQTQSAPRIPYCFRRLSRHSYFGGASCDQGSRAGWLFS